MVVRHPQVRLLWFAFWLTATAAAASDPPAGWIDPAGISGSLVIAGGGALPERVIARFLELGGGERTRLVVIPTASGSANDGDGEQFLRPWRTRTLASLTLLHSRDRTEIDNANWLQPLREATAVWFTGGQQSRLAETYVGTAVEAELNALLARGGVIGGTSAGAAIQSRLMIARGNPQPVTAVGLDLLPGAVIDQHFRQRERQARLAAALADHPGHFGLGIDEATAVVVTGRRLDVLGAQRVTIGLAAGAGRPDWQRELRESDAADLTALRRAARDRAAAPFPPAQPEPPVVEHGALLIAGGGRLDAELLARFIELAGGPDALIVVLPTAGPNPQEDDGMRGVLERAGARNVIVLPQHRRADVEAEAFIAPLSRAGGVWFGGGRQWRFVDAYENTVAQTLFRDVLRRGGVIGGSSAGASIQAEYLARGNPLGNEEIMADGYERGLGFLPAAAIDQHFTQRDRFADLERLVETHPQLLGIGVDESTALLVQGSTATVLGKHQVHFVEQRGAAKSLATQSLADGQRFDLPTRTVIAAGGGGGQ